MLILNTNCGSLNHFSIKALTDRLLTIKSNYGKAPDLVLVQEILRTPESKKFHFGWTSTTTCFISTELLVSFDAFDVKDYLFHFQVLID